MSQLINQENNSVYLITVNDGGRSAGFVATWVMMASLSQKKHKIAFVVSKFNATLKYLLKTKCFVINQLSQNQIEEFYIFGTKNSDQVDKFQNFNSTRIEQGRILAGIAGHATGQIVSSFETPDRVILYCSLDEEISGPGIPMVLKDALAGLDPAQKNELERKMQHDSLRDENQFTPS